MCTNNERDVLSEKIEEIIQQREKSPQEFINSSRSGKVLSMLADTANMESEEAALMRPNTHTLLREIERLKSIHGPAPSQFCSLKELDSLARLYYVSFKELQRGLETSAN